MVTITRAGWLTRWATDPAVQVGVAGASWSLAGTFARGLLPRSPTQQAVAAGIVGAAHFQLTATTWALLQASGAFPGSHPGPRANLVLSAAGTGAGLAVQAVAAPRAGTSMPAAIAAAAGRAVAFSALVGGATAAWDDVFHHRMRLAPGLDTTLLPSIATASVVVAGGLVLGSRRAARYGVVAPDRRAVQPSGLRATATATAIGAASGLGLSLLMAGEQAAARGLERALGRITGSPAGALGQLASHGLLLGAMAGAGTLGLNAVTRRIQRRDDIVEPAYPVPPTSMHVSAGPASSMPFDSLGKEGRRFVLMALAPEEITEVMGEPAVDPVRVVGGYESAESVEERARLALADLVACGGLDRSVICVGVPTGVGYFNYSFTEALEYLTRGDCATVVPQYALVPSALALGRTAEGERLTRLVLEGIATAVAGLPSERRPRLVLAGESLGANVALDVCLDGDGRARLGALDALGVRAGLYLGVPFRTRLWHQWHADPGSVDATGRLVLASEPEEMPHRADAHVMLVHHDDPVNKYGYRLIVQPPWWMGAPASRPPMVPRETKFRPITTFVLSTMDLLNGMQSRPGTFVRRGHDYRYDLRAAIQRAYGLAATPEQEQAIEAALRRREQQWATRRLIARKLDRARRSVERQLAEWGVEAPPVADLDPAAERLGGPLARISAPAS